ncbi:DUF2004 domain-containing protein [Flavobacterium okayamense]|uniref:DUF2004 domain-containing protein n=1 Tax=Flavobacterium okayamense TaxID=2830782 RepID=A0ABN6HWL6_9FLAO|nr:DUF2004 domain-containing protein [Flavobacterium okayamense]BCY28783.1 hypothetical protein KK2020170_16510 [Flavobacterium okayamense]
MKLKYFNEIDLQNLTDYYEVDIDFKGNSVQLDINFQETKINESNLDYLKSILDDLDGILLKVNDFIKNDYKSGEDVKEFLAFHIEELDNDELESLLSDSDKSLSREEQLLSIIKLKRIGFYPEDNDEYVIFDFVTDEEVSQYLLVVKVNSKGQLDHITMES